MPKLYKYFGLIVFFFSNEHEPVHVHGEYKGRSSKAELVIEKGRVVEIRIRSVWGRKPLQQKQLHDFKLLVERRADDIVKKWVDFFVYGKHIRPETIRRRLR
jgi:hypothetical protein